MFQVRGSVLPTPTRLLVLVAVVGLPLLARAQQTVPAFSVDVHASVTDPVSLAFSPDGTLYVGRDASGSGGGAGASVRIHRVSPDGSSVTEYGASAIPDPDALVVDVNGALGSAGSVLVGGLVTVPTGARISEVATNQSVTTLFQSTLFDNPTEMLIDPNGRLLFTNFANPGVDSGVFQSTGGSPTALFTTLDRVVGIGLDPTGRIFVSAVDGTIRIYSSAGALVDGAFATGMGTRPPLTLGALGSLPVGVFTVDASGNLLHIDLSGTQNVLGTGFGLPFDLEFGPDGALYVSDFANDRVLRIAPSDPIPALPPAALITLAILLGAWLMRRRVPASPEDGAA